MAIVGSILVNNLKQPGGAGDTFGVSLWETQADALAENTPVLSDEIRIKNESGKFWLLADSLIDVD